jgi:hypothetical protein
VRSDRYPSHSWENRRSPFDEEAWGELSSKAEEVKRVGDAVNDAKGRGKVKWLQISPPIRSAEVNL